MMMMAPSDLARIGRIKSVAFLCLLAPAIATLEILKPPRGAVLGGNFAIHLRHGSGHRRRKICIAVAGSTHRACVGWAAAGTEITRIGPVRLYNMRPGPVHVMVSLDGTTTTTVGLDIIHLSESIQSLVARSTASADAATVAADDEKRIDFGHTGPYGDPPPNAAVVAVKAGIARWREMGKGPVPPHTEKARTLAE